MRKKRAKERNRETNAAFLRDWRDHAPPARCRRLVGIRGRNLMLKVPFDPETEIRYDPENPMRSGDGVVAELQELSERRASHCLLD